jgi:hypothetical protein
MIETTQITHRHAVRQALGPLTLLVAAWLAACGGGGGDSGSTTNAANTSGSGTGKTHAFKMYTASSPSGPWVTASASVTGAPTDSIGLVDPSPIRMSDGSILLYYLVATISGTDPAASQLNNQWKMGVAKSTDGGLTFQHQGIASTDTSSATDPFPMVLTNGTIRLLISQGNTVKSVTATDSTGLNFAASADAGTRSTVGGVPGALRIGNLHYQYVCGNGIQYLTSTDGMNFTLGGVAIAGGGLITCDPSPIDQGVGVSPRYLMAFKRRAAGGTGPTADTSYMASSPDGITWSVMGTIGSGGVPGLVRDSAGTYRVYVPAGQ